MLLEVYSIGIGARVRAVEVEIKNHSQESLGKLVLISSCMGKMEREKI